MKEAKKRNIYQNYDLDLEDAKESLLSSFDETEITETDIWNEAYQLSEDDYDEFTAEINKLHKSQGKYGLLSMGIIGRWDGNRQGGCVADSWLDFMNKFDVDNIEIWDENGHMFVTGYDHDGSSTVEVKFITQKGKQYLAEHWDEYEWKVYSRMFKNSTYTHIPRFAEKVYGCKRYEYERKVV